ncbi:MAG TPA: hypothetical protein VMH06_02435, partial [Thermodesulfovibrionales bacterium]|nr:hypothetical protein [Thermodesulfovibrionales bacterium]
WWKSASPDRSWPGPAMAVAAVREISASFSGSDAAGGLSCAAAAALASEGSSVITAFSSAGADDKAPEFSRVPRTFTGAVAAAIPGGDSESSETVMARDPLIGKCNSTATSRTPMTWTKREEMQYSLMRIVYTYTGRLKKIIRLARRCPRTEKTPEGVTPVVSLQV